MRFLSQNSTWRPEKQLAGNRSQKKIPFITSKAMQKICYLAGIIFIGAIIIFLSRDPSIVIIKNINIDKKIGMKYILQWTSPNTDPFNLMGEGQEQFLKRKCRVNKCYITPNPNLLNSITDFDAILFHGPEFCQKYVSFPLKRSLHQKYVFASRESPAYYPLDSQRYDGIFNWTYTYKLNSDIYFGYIVIKDKKGEVIGPRQNMHWMAMKDMKAIGKDLRKKLNSKKLAAAWFVSNCHTNSGRETVALELQKELAKRKLVLDIYSEKCEWPGTKTCPKRPQSFVSGTECLRKIETDYYFYLSFENSVTEDYVTEKLLNAVQYYAVPIVYGGANYSRLDHL